MHISQLFLLLAPWANILPLRKFDNQSYLLFFVNTEVYVLHVEIRTLSLIFLCPLKVLRPETWCLEEKMTKGGTLDGRIE